MKRLLIACLALSLGACAPLLSGLASMAGAPASPAAVANQTTLDEKGAIAAEVLYTTFARAGALAFRTNVIAPSSNPAVQSDGFCPSVLRREFTPTDRGSEVMALECKLRAARDAARAAYDAGNALNYQVAFGLALAAYNEGMALIRRD